MIRKLPIILIILGLGLMGIGGYQFLKTNKAQKDSLVSAYDVLATPIEKESFNTPVDFSPRMGEVVGVLEIPQIEANLAIVEGTNEDELAKGVGHLKESAYPDQNNQIVLSGHRDTVFRRMGELNIGDELIIALPYGRYIYKITDTKIVDANNTTVIKNTFPHEELIVTTCYPFTFIGNAPERYIITALPVDNHEMES
ncbi:class D sortase [Robertmurraya massiliosenegalensis]|uniref:class D sortase n=1 Tax=Robertmurraya massiliosenegalensis TaxID=1287657 RepID=UPI0002E6E5DE|nr:class D sortase [Robertmurraya massiliosenegalensis]